jgi:hypothetical protein
MTATQHSAILGVGLFILGVGVGAQGFTRTQYHPVVEAGEIRIVDPSGRPRDHWGFEAPNQDLELVLLDQRGQERIRPRVDEQGRAGMSLSAGEGDSSFKMSAPIPVSLLLPRLGPLTTVRLSFPYIRTHWE